MRLVLSATEGKRVGRKGGGIVMCFSRLDCCDEGLLALGVSLCRSGVGNDEAGILLNMHFSDRWSKRNITVVVA
jgi:hypothetical protein